MTAESIVHFVDDDPAARESLLQLAKSVGLTAYAYGSGEEFLEQVSPSQPGCVVLDIRLPGISGLEVHRRINQANLPLIVIFLSAHADVPTTVQAMKLGAFELFQKPCNTTRLIEAIRQALDKNRQSFQKHVKRLEAENLLHDLSTEETKVLELMFLGRTNQEIADRLQLSLRTVQFRRSSIFRKTNVESKATLFDMLFDAGWSPNTVVTPTEEASQQGN